MFEVVVLTEGFIDNSDSINGISKDTFLVKCIESGVILLTEFSSDFHN